MPALPRFSSVAVSRIAFVNLIANGVIVVTGGVVRLTGSGLGCPTWPKCSSTSFVTTRALSIHGAIEFGNRTFNGLLGVVAAVTFLAVLLSPRRDLRRLALVSLLGIPAQATLGGITVLSKLNPWVVGCHFLLSAVLVAVATALWLRSREPGVGEPLISRPLVALIRAIALAVAAVIVVGTVVTGSGPHAGDAHSRRTGLDPEQVAQLHADLVWLLVGLTVALLFTLYATDSPGRLRRAARDLLLVELAQGVIGYVQYFTHLPVAVVLLHMLGAVLVTVFTARLVWSVRGPVTDAPLDAPAELPASALG